MSWSQWLLLRKHYLKNIIPVYTPYSASGSQQAFPGPSLQDMVDTWDERLDKLHKGLPDSSLASASGSHYRQSESAWGGAILHPSSTHLFVYTDHASVVISILLARGWYTRAQFCTFHNHGFMLLLFLCLAICIVTGKTLGQSHQQPFSFSAQPLNLNYTREFLPKY